MIARIPVICVFNILLISSFYLHAVPANTVVKTINVGVTPGGMAVTPDNKYLYVANNNNYGVDDGTNNADSITVIDLSNNTVLDTIYDASFAEPYTVTINPAGTKAYVTNSNSTFPGTVTIIDLATNTVSGVITGFDGPSGMVITPDGLTGYVNNYGGPGGLGSGSGTTVRVVNLTTNLITGPAITVDQAPAALAITPSGSYVYVANYVLGAVAGGTVNVIQTSDNTVIDTITGFSGPFDIVISSDGAYAYVTNFGSNNFTPFGNTLSVINLSNDTIVDTITLGIQPSGIALTPDDSLAYVSNYNTLYAGAGFTDLTPGQGVINIIDTATDTVLAQTIVVGQSPDFIVIPSNGEYAYVSNYISNTVSVIALQSFQITLQGCKTENRFLTQVDSINKLTWTVTGTSLPVSYSIYRDAQLTDLAGVVASTEPFVFLDHNRDSSVTYTYYIVGTNGVGTTSIPVSVTVTASC